MPRPRLLLLLLAGALVLSLVSRDTQALRTASRERRAVVLWAWERPEDLEFVDAGTAGIAFLAGTVRIHADGTFSVVPRRQPLKVKEHVSLTAVVRIEPDRRARGGPSHAAAVEMASAIGDLAGSFRAASLQIDFDARVSERAFYRDLLTGLRRALPPDVSLSMTALASWCVHDRWMDGLPVDEAVPMLFRMGPERREILRTLEARGGFREPLCQASVGISTDEPLRALPPQRRIYVFSPVPWTESSVEHVLQEAEPWQ